jgi:histidinol dehydrogenase
MKILSYKQPEYASELAALSRRAIPEASVEHAVSGIISQVLGNGDKALVDYAAKFDKVSLKIADLRVTPAELKAAEAAVPANIKAALKTAHANVHAFSRQSMRQSWKMKNAQGASVGEIYQPFNRVGLYVPGGSAPLVSSAIMTATLAQAAECPEIVVCTPCGKDGKVNPALLCALKLAGATEIYRVGGAQAIAAMAYGTTTISQVDKIFGPGNKYVVEAKRQVFGTVAIDLLPGPSEIMILADETADPRYVAADLLAQAEHGHDGQILLATTSATLLKSVGKEIEQQMKSLPRAELIQEIIQTGTWLVLLKNLAEGIQLCNDYAPEHLSLIVKDDSKVIPQIRTAGAIFVGNYSPVAAGDFLTGPSHTLPTGGAGKSFSGLTVDMFQRRTSIVRMDRKSLEQSVPVVEAFAEVEGLQAHGRSASIRMRR